MGGDVKPGTVGLSLLALLASLALGAAIIAAPSLATSDDEERAATPGVVAGTPDSQASVARPARRELPPALQPVAETPGLPRVLILGDSISMGYTLAVRSALSGAANVLRPAENCRSTAHARARLETWIGDRRWDLIYFNFGLHDMYRAPDAAVPGAAAPAPAVPLDAYEANLEAIVTRLQRTGAKLVFATTTPVPEGARNRLPADAALYNERALRVMSRHSVKVDDLGGLAAEFIASPPQRPAATDRKSVV